MMNSAGIIAEYNPFHNGHAFHLEKTLEITGADAVIAVMSGSLTQRGQFPLTDKWTRAEAAVRSGIDLVVEMPAVFSCSSAGYFAASGVEILENLGVSQISFGSESGDIDTLTAIAGVLEDNRDAIEEKIRLMVKQGLSYPRARRSAVEELLDEESAAVLDSPNNLLGLEYIRHMKTAQPVTVKRAGPGYGEKFGEGIYASASYIRECIFRGQNTDMWLTDSSKDMLSQSQIADSDRRFPMIAERILTASDEELESLAAAGEGLGSKLKSSVRKCSGEEELIGALKSKRYTYTRISRLMGQVLTGITANDVREGRNYVRVLAFNEKGSRYLREVKDSGICHLPIITNINKEWDDLREVRPTLEKDILAADLYNLAAGRDMYRHSDFVERPRICT